MNPDLKNLRAFRVAYPQGRNYVVVPRAKQPTPLRVDGLEVELVTPAHLMEGRTG